MNSLNKLQIYIVEFNPYSASIFKKVFKGYKNIKVINDDLMNFFNQHQEEIDCITSPANSYGHMSGGFDARISDILGWDFQYQVQDYIKTHYHSCQPIGTSFIINTPIKNLKLIHTPTMVYPSKIKDPTIIYKCTISTLKLALTHNIKSIILPIFGGDCGGLTALTTSKQMKKAIDNLLNEVEEA